MKIWLLTAYEQYQNSWRGHSPKKKKKKRKPEGENHQNSTIDCRCYASEFYCENNALLIVEFPRKKHPSRWMYVWSRTLAKTVICVNRILVFKKWNGVREFN